VCRFISRGLELGFARRRDGACFIVFERESPDPPPYSPFQHRDPKPRSSRTYASLLELQIFGSFRYEMYARPLRLGASTDPMFR